jgi:hypothetical protein
MCGPGLLLCEQFSQTGGWYPVICARSHQHGAERQLDGVGAASGESAVGCWSEPCLRWLPAGVDLVPGLGRGVRTGGADRSRSFSALVEGGVGARASSSCRDEPILRG